MQSRGAAAVEFALLAGLFILIVFGIIEVGLTFRAQHSLDHGTAQAARAGTVAGPSALADYKVLEVLQDELASSADDIDRVVIYKATQPDQDPPAACLVGQPSSPALACNVYLPADLNRAEADFGSCTLERSWCPTDRVATLNNPDYLGVWVQAQHRSPTGILPDRTITERMVLPLEPSQGPG